MAVAGGRDGRPLRHERNGFTLSKTARAMVLLAIVIVGMFVRGFTGIVGWCCVRGAERSQECRGLHASIHRVSLYAGSS